MNRPRVIDQSDGRLSRRAALRLGVGGLGGALAGCLGTTSTDSAEWPTFAHDAANTGAADVSGLADPTLRWRQVTGYGVTASPAVADGTVYVSDRGGLYAFDLETGDEVASFDRFSSELRGTPTVVDDTVYVSMSGTGHLYVYDTDGVEQWTTSLGPTRHPVVVDDVVYVQTVEMATLRTRALEVDGGDEVWAVDHGYADASIWTPAVADGTVYVTVRARGDQGERSYVAALDADTGDERWRTEAFVPRSSPAVDDGTLFVLGDDSIAAFDAETGDRRWLESHAFPSGDFWSPLYSPAIAEETIYAGVGSRDQYPGLDEDDATGAVIAVDRESGDEEWTFEADRPGATVSVGTDVVYANTIGGLYALEPANGDVRWEYDSPPFDLPAERALVTAPPAVVDDAVVVGSPDGAVSVLEES